MSANEYLRIIQRELNGGERVADTVEAGYMTTSQYAAKLQVSLNTAERRLREGMGRKTVVAKIFRVITPLGRLFPVRHYRVVGSKKA